jgi:hypothetical protein
MVIGSETFFRSNSDSFTFHDHALFVKGNIVEALHNLAVETNIMSQFLVETLISNIPLVSTNKLFKSPSGLILKCCGIARALPIKIDKTEVRFDFHIYAIVDFELLICYPFEKLFQEKSFHGDLIKKLLSPPLSLD